MNYEVMLCLTQIEALARDAKINIANTESAGKAAAKPIVSLPRGKQPPTPDQFQAAAQQTAGAAQNQINAIINLAQELAALGKPPGAAEEPETPAEEKAGPPDPETAKSATGDLAGKSGLVIAK